PTVFSFLVPNLEAVKAAIGLVTGNPANFLESSSDMFLPGFKAQRGVCHPRLKHVFLEILVGQICVALIPPISPIVPNTKLATGSRKTYDMNRVSIFERLLSRTRHAYHTARWVCPMAEQVARNNGPVLRSLNHALAFIRRPH